MPQAEPGARLFVARFTDPDQAYAAVEGLIECDYPMDRISMLGLSLVAERSPVGIYYRTTGERMRGWGGLEPIWEGLWGVLAGAAGLFIVPGLGPLAAAGPVVDALAASGRRGAGTEPPALLETALQRAGLPAEEMTRQHRAIQDGEYLMLLRCSGNECERYRPVVLHAGAGEVLDHPVAAGRL